VGVGEELQPGDPERIGPYRVTGRLGSGGMGRVFLCRSAGGRPVAVKVIRAVLTFAATGHGPFGSGTTAALVYRVVHGHPALDDVSLDIRALVGRCLAKEPGHRPTARDLLAELGDTGVMAGWLPAPASP